MEDFFLDDNFCSDLGDLANIYDIGEDNVKDLKENWIAKVELSDLEPIFDIDAEKLCQILADSNENNKQLFLSS